MSDDERSDASSVSGGSEDLNATGLIATRAKRSTAGNLYASLRANLDDEDVRKDLLAEDEEDDAGDYEGSDKGDDDDALESSSDEEDAGPPKDGESEDFEGEKALKKEERAEMRKKRKVQDARLKLPSWQKKNKKVKLADDAKTDDGAVEKPKKKSERANWLPTAADAPKRQSGRALAVANRETIHANLKQSYERSEKQRKVMKDAAERVQLKKRRPLQQHERMEMCAKITKQTDKEFGRWEREEAERQRLRDEQLAAKRAKGFDGPFFRHWSGSVMWEGDKIKVRRMSHGSQKVEEIQTEPAPASHNPASGTADTPAVSAPTQPAADPTSSHPPNAAIPPPAAQQTPAAMAPAGTPTPSAPPIAPAPSAPVGWLQGIHDYAAQPAPPVQPPSQPSSSATQLTPYSVPAAPHAATAAPPPSTGAPVTFAPYGGPVQQPSSQLYQSWPPGSQRFSVNLPAAPPPPPVIREQAQRSLIMLEQFEELENITKRNKTASVLEPTVPASIMLPDSYPSLSSDEVRYLTAKHSKRNGGVMPPGPTKPYCAILAHKEARFRDPKTGLPYFDMHMYKIIQRVLAGGCQWSTLLGAWVGPRCDGVMGRPARGVPEGFAGPPKATRTDSTQVKVEQGAA